MMAGATLVSVEEYLRTDYKPACDYIDGVLRQKSMPAFDHGEAQFAVCFLIRRFGGFTANAELTCRVRDGKYLVPDVAVMSLGDIQDPYPTRPIHLCVEILSPEDRFSDTVAKCAEYHAWGVQYSWIIDPDNKQCWEYHAGSRPNPIPADGQITAGPVALGVAEIFA
jgi:Uma2 family endonuclease